MQKKLNKIVNRTNRYLYKYFSKQKKTELIKPMLYGLLPGGKKVRSKILFDIGSIFKVDKKNILQVAAAVECIHAYSLIHDDLPCMDNDNLRRGKLTTHKKFSESTAILAGNSLLTIAFQILSEKRLRLDNQKKIKLINLLSESSGHTGIAGGQFLDLSYEKIKKTKKQIIDMQIKKTGKLFSFCCAAPAIIKGKDNKEIKFFEDIGSNVGLLFQIADDLIDFKGNSKKAGKQTGKDQKKGKATLISLLGHSNAVKYCNKIIFDVDKGLKIYGPSSKNIKQTLDYILNRDK